MIILSVKRLIYDRDLYKAEKNDDCSQKSVDFTEIYGRKYYNITNGRSKVEYHPLTASTCRNGILSLPKRKEREAI